MKTCPACGRHYEDDTLVFCLQDGARLGAETSENDVNATLNMPVPPPTVPGPTVFQQPSASAQSTMTARPEQFHSPTRPTVSESEEGRPRHSPLPWILAIVVVIGIFGALIAWIVTRSGGNESPTATSSATPTPRDDTATLMSTPDVMATPQPSPTQAISNDSPQIEKPKPTPTAERAKAAFSLLNNTSYSGGSRITYYPRASVGQCQADCAANANCRAFTWIRPAAYNPGDAAMCYLMYSVTGPVSHPCCISGVKN
jgi:hypothetical protein